VTDSAGIVLVDNLAAGQWIEAWSVEPDLTFGEAEGNEDYVFGRVADVAVDGRGRFFVLDQQAQEVKVYDATGAFVTTMGGAGRGPGELSRFANAVLLSSRDTVFVPDYAQARVSVYGPGGVYARTISLPPRPGGRSWALIDDRRFMYRGITLSRDELGRWQSWDGLLRSDAANAALDTVLQFDYEATELGTRENLRVPLIVNNAFWDRRRDGRIAWSAYDQDRVFIHSADGTLRRIVTHRDWRRRPPSDADVAAMVELLRQKLRMLGGDDSAADGSNVDAPETLPAITAVRAGPEGTWWVQRMGAAASIDPMAINAQDRSSGLGGPEWDVFDADGRFLGPLRLPERFRVTRITDDWVVGVQQDELDVERVTRLRLRRS
jgi:hypothetical protein